MTVTSEYELMMFISHRYHERKSELTGLGKKFKTDILFQEVINYAYSLYATSLGFETTSQIKVAFNKWRKERKKGIKNTNREPVAVVNKKEVFVDPLVEQIKQLDLNPESYF